jgi:hypothetical protein
VRADASIAQCRDEVLGAIPLIAGHGVDFAVLAARKLSQRRDFTAPSAA